MSTVEDLIEKINLYSHTPSLELEKVISKLATEIFISLDGYPDFDNMFKVEDATLCKIYSGEKDSFGWLSSIINISGREIMFG